MMDPDAASQGGMKKEVFKATLIPSASASGQYLSHHMEEHFLV